MSEIQTQRPYWDGGPTSLAPLWGWVIDRPFINVVSFMYDVDVPGNSQKAKDSSVIFVT